MKPSAPTAPRRFAWRWFTPAVLLLGAVALAFGTVRNPHFWLTADQRGDRLFHEGKFLEAARAYSDPARIGAAQYRAGEFKDAAATFTRVPGPTGAYDRATALLMHGDYDSAITGYDRALALRPGWTEAKENRALAAARRDRLKVDDKTREQEQADDAYKPDEVVTDNRGGDKEKPPADLGVQTLSDEQLQATWLRRLKTTPGDFLRAKFAWQAQHASAPAQSKGAVP